MQIYLFLILYIASYGLIYNSVIFIIRYESIQTLFKFRFESDQNTALVRSHFAFNSNKCRLRSDQTPVNPIKPRFQFEQTYLDRKILKLRFDYDLFRYRYRSIFVLYPIRSSFYDLTMFHSKRDFFCVLFICNAKSKKKIANCK